MVVLGASHSTVPFGFHRNFEHEFNPCLDSGGRECLVWAAVPISVKLLL